MGIFSILRSRNYVIRDVDLFDSAVYQNYFEFYPHFLSDKRDVLFFKKSNCYGIFKYDIVKEVLQAKDIFLSSNVYPEDERILLNADYTLHSTNKKVVINHLSFLREDTISDQYNLIQVLFKRAFLMDKREVNVIDRIVNPFVLNVMLKNFELLTHYPSLDILSSESSYEEKILLIKEIFKNGGIIDALMKEAVIRKSFSQDIQTVLSEFRENSSFKEEDLLKFMKIFIRAGILTTSSLLGACIYYFDKFDEQRINDDSYLESYIDEVLRIDSPSQFSFRRTAKAVRVGEITIPENALIAVSFGAANRDERKFINASEFIATRREKHLAFGIGKHKCIGDKITMVIAKYFIRAFLPFYQTISIDKDSVLHDNSIHIYRISQLVISKREIGQNELTEALVAIHNNSPDYYYAKDLVYFSDINVYGAFKYSVVKEILNSDGEIGVSVVHLSLNNIYFSQDEKVHQLHKKTAITHLSFLSSKLQYADSDYTRLLFDKLRSYFPVNKSFDLVDYLINPLVLINVFNEYGFLEVFPDFDFESTKFDFAKVIQRVKEFFEDTDKLELMLKEHLENGGVIPGRMQALLDEMTVGETVNKHDLPRFFRSMIFSAVESTASFLSSFVYTMFTKYPELIARENSQKELYWIANEVLRIYTPVPFIYRTVWKDTVFAGTELKKGDMIVLFLGAANNDPSVFHEPSLFKEIRERHLSFGGGSYACIGRFASFRITMNVFSYLSPIAGNLEFLDGEAKHYIHNSMLKLPLNVIYRD